MSKLFNHLNTSVDELRMTEAEKRTMLMNLHTALSVTPIASPYQRFFAPRVLVPVLSAVLIVGSGTAYAAQGALPGSPLYAIKIHVNERVEAALATTPAAKAQVNAAIAARRVEEVQLLAAQNKLDASTTAQIEENFDYHTSQAAKFAQSSDDTRETGKALAAKISASLDTLAALSSTTPVAKTPAMTAGIRATATLETAATSTSVSEDASENQNVQNFVEHARANNVGFFRSNAGSENGQINRGNKGGGGGIRGIQGRAVVCTMDAKICPDGTAVGRVGPNCDFAPCPSGDSVSE